MSVNKEKIYDPEFRESSVRLAIESKNSIAQTARELGVNSNTLYTWITKSKTGSSTKIVKDNDPLQLELKRLKKEIIQVTLERDILKKATAFFAKQIL